MALACVGDIVVARLRPDAIGFDVFFETDAADRVGVGISVGQMGTVGGIGLEEIISEPISSAVRRASVKGSAGSTGT